MVYSFCYKGNKNLKSFSTWRWYFSSFIRNWKRKTILNPHFLLLLIILLCRTCLISLYLDLLCWYVLRSRPFFCFSILPQLICWSTDIEQTSYTSTTDWHWLVIYTLSLEKKKWRGSEPSSRESTGAGGRQMVTTAQFINYRIKTVWIGKYILVYMFQLDLDQ